MLTSDAFETDLTASLQKEIHISPARSHWASVAGHPCDRYLVWRWTRWKEQQGHDVGLQAVFAEGHTHQTAVVARLTKMGFEITETDRPFEYGGYSGKLDGKVKSYKGERWEPALPIEIKSCSPHVFAVINSEADIAASKHHYIRSYKAQITLYMLMDNVERGAYIFKSKTSGWLKWIPATLDWTLANSLIERAKRLTDMVSNHVDPPPISYDDGICGRCGFLALCYPPKDFGEGAELVTDQDFIDDLTRHQELKPAHAEYDALDKVISARVKNHPLIMAGDYVIEGKEQARKGFTVADSVTWRKTIKRVVNPLPGLTEEST